MWGSNGEAWKREHPRARPVRLLFQDERATPAVLTFLMETKVGKVVNLASLWERDGGKIALWERDGEEIGEIEPSPMRGRGVVKGWRTRRAGPARPKNVPSLRQLYTFPLFFPLPLPSTFQRKWGKEKGKPHFDGLTPWAFLGEVDGRG